MPGTTTPEPVPFEQVTEAQLPCGVEHGDVGGRAEPVLGTARAAMAADPGAAADPFGDLVEVGGEKPLHVGLVVEALMEVVGSPGVGRLRRGDELLDAAAVAQALEHSQRVGDQDPARGRAAGW